jgi:pyruvate dehydrogenase E1 component
MKTESAATAVQHAALDNSVLDRLQTLEKRVLWLSSWIIHNANHLRPKRDGLKVGGHQASSASSVSLLTALFFEILNPEDRIAVKPHASPAFHAIQYLLGNQTRERLEAFRSLGGAQSYPSRTKDHDPVDFSTGSEGLGAGITIFAALTQEYLRRKALMPETASAGRMVAVMGDAEFDEGNVFEALLEGWKHDVRNVWWVIDYNRQSLDRILDDQLYDRIQGVFRTLGWNVHILKYGRRLQEAFARPGGAELKKWLDSCPNDVYSALVYASGASWRDRLRADIGSARGVRALLADYDDDALARLMTNLGGHDMRCLIDAFTSVDDDRPQCFIAYTIKGHGLPFAGHKDNHSGLMSVEQIDALQRSMGIARGAEWEPLAAVGEREDELRRYLGNHRLATCGERDHHPHRISVASPIAMPAASHTSTQEAFGRFLTEISRVQPALAERIVTASPDVMISTSLGGWVNRKHIFGSKPRSDVFSDFGLGGAQRWTVSPDGQHIELGIAENNLFLLLAALGLSAPLFGVELFPIGTIYDTFIPRGLDALNYGCYQDSRFILVGTPSGITLAPEGGAHQSITTPLIGIGQPGLLSYEAAYADEVAVILEWALRQLHEPDGRSVYIRLSTRVVSQPNREMSDELRAAILAGGYWIVPPRDGADLAIVCCGAVATEAMEAYAAVREDTPGIGVAVVTSADRLCADWNAHDARPASERRIPSHVDKLLEPLSPNAQIITVLDGHPLALSWLGGVRGNRVRPLGVTRFGQSGDIPDLYREYRIDSEAIIDAVARACLDAAARSS